MTQYLVSIDLGTTNTVVAYTRLGAAAGQEVIELFDIEQLLGPGAVGPRPLLPSLRYHPAPGELAAGALQLPWPALEPEVATGMLARQLGAQVPGRLVASAKSWLSHAGVDRLAPILPWGAAEEVGKISPVAASASFLAYVRAAWNWRFPQQRLEDQQVVLTIPASFDEGARALTLSAAQQAGLPKLRLLEEPQAAFYDWLFRHRATRAKKLADTRLVLVCDVGGGTTDFSLIKVELQDGQPRLTRIAVGNHLMLGGDNMDLTLAHLVETRITAAASEAGAARLSAGALSQLMERCRAAKEQLLTLDAPERVSVSVLGAGARLIGGTRSVDLTREEVARLIVDGFFPRNRLEEGTRRGRAGIVEFGLPYASDAAITRHLASFLQQHAAAAREALGLPVGALALPDTLLLNGGVFRADALAARLQSVLADWRGSPLHRLDNLNPDVAVARGGVAYGLGQLGLAPTIGGGAPRNYFLLLDDGRPDAPQRAVCILPRGSAEGQEIRLTERMFSLRVGRPVRFHLASSNADMQSAPQLGELVTLEHGDFVRLPPIATVLQAASHTRSEIAVQLATTLTEVGTLEVHCVATEDGAHQRWLLEFQLRGEPSATPSEPEAALPASLKPAIEKIERIFGNRAQQVTVKEVRQLRQQLEQLLGSREQWATPLLRQLFDALWQRARGRRRSAEHERVWLNLCGYCLRPGFGDALDTWRMEQLWPMFEQGVQYAKDHQVCAEWWTLWRRVCAGLSAPEQLRLLEDFGFNLQTDAAALRQRPPTLVSGSADEMVRLGVSLERIPATYKTEIGVWLLDRIDTDAADSKQLTLWAIGRIGARQPFYGSAHDVIPSETVAGWLNIILALDWKRVEAAGFAATHLARMCGDRNRDIPPALRATLLERLRAVGAPADWIAMVEQVAPLDQASERRMLGESLPPGLKLIR